MLRKTKNNKDRTFIHKRQEEEEKKIKEGAHNSSPTIKCSELHPKKHSRETSKKMSILSESEFFTKIIDFGYKLRSVRTGYVFRGFTQLGRIINTETSEESIKRSVKSWIKNIIVAKGPQPHLIAYIEIPDTQDIVQVDFATKYFIVGLSTNLGLPAYELNTDELEIIDFDIYVRRQPVSFTTLV
uniref:Uncharacterized protein n=1 Tax=Cryptotermes secundus lispivirus 1 TaxID=3133545 RepID=A0AAT9JN84_9MONO